MFFKRSKSELVDPVTEFRAALNHALDVPGVSRHRQAEILEKEAQAIRVSIACSEPCPEAASAGMYDVARLQIKDPPKPAPKPHLAPLRYPQSNDAADVAAYWAEMEARQRGR